jgi:ABC-type Fe3+/spermidine/putrescine transport system ATPase subunit
MLAGSSAPGLAPGTVATIVLRPEALRLAPPGSGRLQGVAGHAAFLGESVSLGVVLADGRELQASLAPRDPCPAPGSAVALDWDPAEAPIVPA